jgi:hypothetical protein
VLLLLASQYSFEYHRRERKDLDTLLAETPDEPVPTPQPLLEEPPVVESESVPVESPPPTKLDEHMLSELNQTLSQELETQKEVADTWMSKFIQYSKLYDDERQEKAALQSEIERLKQLESDLATAQAERDRLAAAHGYEMERADALATQLVELQTVEPPAETPAVVSEPTVDSDVITVDDPLPVVQPQKTVTLQDIKTYGVTNQAIFYHPSEEYVNFEGKQISINALKGLRPDLLLSPGDPVNQILFGNTFPKYSKIGDIYIRTDAMPHIVFKFNGTKWIEVDKNQNTSYVQYIPYLQYLIQKCESGEYDADYLTDAEREEIESHLANK